jgi:hypothetical protein
MPVSRTPPRASSGTTPARSAPTTESCSPRPRRRVWESFRVEIDETIAITTHIRGRDGIDARARTTWLFTIHDGKIERVCLYQEKAEALEAAGLPE